MKLIHFPLWSAIPRFQETRRKPDRGINRTIAEIPMVVAKGRIQNLQPRHMPDATMERLKGFVDQPMKPLFVKAVRRT
jgi:hypothetical protein